MDDIAAELIRRQEEMAGERGVWESHWEEIAKRVLPRHSDLFTSRGDSTEGEKKTEEQVDGTASFALDRLASILESMLTPRNQRWHRLRASVPALNKSQEVLRYFDAVSDILFHYRYLPKANFGSQNFENYTSLGAFGTGAMFIDRLDGGGLRYKAVHLSELFFKENHQGVIDLAHRRFKLTARQAAQKFGADKLPDVITRELEKNPNKKFEFIHCVAPREDLDYSKKDFRGMAFGSYYVSVEGKNVVGIGGYHSFPYAISRYVTAPNETYGRSPAMMVLPNIKVLNEQKKTMLKQGHRVVDPVLLAHDDGVLDTFSLKPGAINAGGVSADGRALVQALPTGNLAAGQELMDSERQIINDAFLVTLFQILVETPRMTATEVLERAREKGDLLGPTMGRQQSEYLGPMIERELDILRQDNLLPPMPQALLDAQGEYQVVYDSPLSRLMKAEEAGGFSRWVEMATVIANAKQDPSILDWINEEAAMPELAEALAVPARWVATQDQVEAKAEGRQQAAATQQAIEAGPAVAALLKTAKEPNLNG